MEKKVPRRSCSSQEEGQWRVKNQMEEWARAERATGQVGRGEADWEEESTEGVQTGDRAVDQRPP